MPERTDRQDFVSLAAAASNMNVEFLTGVRAECIPEDALPPGGSTRQHKIAKVHQGKLEVAYECFTTLSCYPTRGRVGS
jgi:hypothetical protein